MVSFIAVLRIMQASQKFAKCCFTLKVPQSIRFKCRFAAAPSVALLAFIIPLFSFQGAVKRVTLAGVQSVDLCGICVPSKLNNVSGEGLT